jgi:hypothetical protein
MNIIHSFKLDGYFDYFLKKYEKYPITIYWDTPINYKDIDHNNINIFFAHEPDEIFRLHTWATYNYNLFDYVISWEKNTINNIPNGIEFPCSWRINSNTGWEFLGEKQFEVSFLSGVKNLTEGHKLRHKVYSLENQITIPKKWHKVLDDYDYTTNTRPGYKDYSKDLSHIPNLFKFDPFFYRKQFLYTDSMFHIGIENIKKENWLNDRGWSCFSSKVVPIYWGCPNLTDFGYDERGIIRFEDQNDLLHILNNLTEEDYYTRLPYIEHNYQINKLDTLENKLSFIIDELIKTNDIPRNYNTPA